jgi:murein L,D-transpeptidase YcbB/YkuD
MSGAINARYRSLPVRLVVAVGAVILASAGCGGGEDGQTDVERAQSVVTDKQKALSDAQAQLDAAGDAFCKSSQSYVTALDRYGDVLTDTAPTVGDVTTAGSDLTKPREDTVSDAEDVASAREAVATTEQELADAEAALAAAKAAEAGKPAPSATPAGTPATTPAVPAVTADRVEQAEKDFAAAREGISDRTPLREAAQEFNAAAVALEMSWLRLFAEAGCLTDEQQEQAEKAVHDYTTALQTSLAEAGHYQDDVDGIYGPATVEAVKAVQKAGDLPVTGTVDKATDAALQAEIKAKGGAEAQQELTSTAALQQTLKLAGAWTGPVDGVWTPELTEALKDFQEDLGVKPTGTVDAATVAAFEEAIATAKEGAAGEPSPTVSP